MENERIRLNKHVDESNNKKRMSIWTMLIIAALIIFFAIRIPYYIQSVKLSNSKAARRSAENAVNTMLIEEDAYIEDYTIYVVKQKDEYYIYWYINQIKALCTFDDNRGYEPPIDVDGYSGKYPPFSFNPFSVTQKLDENGDWKTIVTTETAYGFLPFGSDDGAVSKKQSTYDKVEIIESWKHKLPENVEIYRLLIDGQPGINNDGSRS